MKTSWTKGLDATAKKEVTLAYTSSGVLRERLGMLLKEKIDSAQRESITKDLYSNPNWQFLQADNVGYQRALKEIINLI